MDGNDKLEEQLDSILKNTEAREALSKSLGIPPGGTGEKES